MKTMKTTKMTRNFFYAAAALTLLACESDDLPEVINEEELITTVEVTLTNTTDPNNVVVYKRVDLDGDGPGQPIFTTTGNVQANATYTGATRFLNETTNPVEDITVEVAEEATEHEVFYLPTVSGLTISKTDLDSDGNPLGLRFTARTAAAGTGNLTVVLRHEPKKPNNNTLSDAGGETDVQVVFSVNVL